MKTRKSVTPKSTPAKKTLTGKKTPEAPTSAKGTKASPIPKTPDPPPTSDPKRETIAVEGTGTPSVGKKSAASTKGPVKKAVKGKSPLSSAKTAGKKLVAAKEADQAKAGEKEVNVGVMALKSEAVQPMVEAEAPKQQEGHTTEDNADEEYEDVMELNEAAVINDDKGKAVDVSVKDNKTTAINVNVPDGGDRSMGRQGEADNQERVDEGLTEGEELEDVEEDEEEEASLHEEVQIEISDMANQRKLKKENEIFVGGLDRDAAEEDVKKAFETIGDVVEVRLHKDFVTNKNKGFAFVKFSGKEQANKVLAELKNPIICGKRCGIAPSEDNDTLFLGNICNTWTKEAVKRKLQEYGVEGIENVNLVGDSQNEGLSRGFAFIEFSCHVDAMNAYKRLQKPDVIFGHPERTAKVAFAEPLREPDPEIMAQVKSVFVDGLPPYWDEDRVKEQFKEFGDIERVVLARNMSSAKRKDFGFVNFAAHESAIACIKSINNTELGDEKSKMTVRARLANPLPKSQAVKGGISGGFRIGQFRSGAYSRFGRGFGRGRFSYGRAGFLGGRGFHPHGRGRGRVGGFTFPDKNFRIPFSEFNQRRPFRGRGGRRGVPRSSYESPRDEFSPRFSSARNAIFNRGPGNPFDSRRPPFILEGDFGGPSDNMQFDEDPYLYGDVGHSLKRPFSMMEHDPRYLEPLRRQHPRYGYADPLSGGAHYRDTVGPADPFYSELSGPDFGDVDYLAMYGGYPSGDGYYN